MEAASPTPRPIRVALPMVTLVPGMMGGSETYVEELATRLPQQPDVDVVVSVPRGAPIWAGDRTLVSSRVSVTRSSLGRLTNQARTELDTDARSPFRTADVVHYPLTVPSPRPRRGVPWVQTLLDTQHHDLRSNFSRSELIYRRWRYDEPARRATAVITISEFCKERITTHLGIPADRIHVAHLGVDTTEFVPNRGPRDRFVLYPARGWPHKNHRVLLEAMAVVRRDHPDLLLVLTGGGLDDLGPLPPWVDVRGLVSRADLLDLYRRAACLAFPSTYEGFGLPPLEAMASGCPVAAASAGSLPEVCGDAAALFDPHDSASVARGIAEALDRSDELAARGLERVTGFSWERCVRTHVDVYREVVARRK